VLGRESCARKAKVLLHSRPSLQSKAPRTILVSVPISTSPEAFADAPTIPSSSIARRAIMRLLKFKVAYA
jgi:hypothetical protein